MDFIKQALNSTYFNSRGNFELLLLITMLRMDKSIESEMYRISCRQFSKMQPGPQMIKTASGSIQAHYQPGQKEPIIWVKEFRF